MEGRELLERGRTDVGIARRNGMKVQTCVEAGLCLGQHCWRLICRTAPTLFLFWLFYGLDEEKVAAKQICFLLPHVLIFQALSNVVTGRVIYFVIRLLSMTGVSHMLMFQLYRVVQVTLLICHKQVLILQIDSLKGNDCLSELIPMGCLIYITVH